MENERKSYLESLGFTEVECVEVEGYDTEFHFESDGMPCSIYEDEFQVGDTSSEILRSSAFYSCCGDILDKDLMICPTCHEHC